MALSILISICFLSGSGVILALLLVFAEKKILNYGPCKININDGKKDLTVKGGLSLLVGLSENEMFIPSACGGRGSCAYCKVKVLEGGGIINPVEEPYLTPQEKKDDIRLACQVKVRNDLKIKIPNELFSIQRFLGRLVRKKSLTHDIVELFIELIQPDHMEFIAGQYIQLESEEYKSQDAVMRAYSIASLPSDKNHIKLIVKRVPHGICTTWVFDYLNEGQNVKLSGPYGEFQLTETDNPIIFVAGGSGMAPIWCMLNDMNKKKINRKASYFFGAATKQDLFYIDALESMEKSLPAFKFIPALSSEPEDSGWKGERGLVTEVLDKHLMDCSGHEAFLCGSPGMIDACCRVLLRNGIAEDKIFFDKF
jgi:Na+-transporting NADH:ubiquinone oxidoreductase subunit F